MSFSLIAHRADGLGVNGGTSGAIDSTGADLIIIMVACDGGGIPAASDISDSKSNTYVEIGTGDIATFCAGRAFYCASPSVGASHTITVSKVNSAASIAIQAWSGAHASPFVSEDFNNSPSGTTLQPGSLTPPEDNCLVFAGIAMGNITWDSINGGFTIASQAAFSGGNNYACGSGYLVQTSAAAANPTFTVSGSDEKVVMIAVFKPAAAGSIVGNLASGGKLTHGILHGRLLP